MLIYCPAFKDISVPHKWYYAANIFTARKVEYTLVPAQLLCFHRWDRVCAFEKPDMYFLGSIFLKCLTKDPVVRMENRWLFGRLDGVSFLFACSGFARVFSPTFTLYLFVFCSSSLSGRESGCDLGEKWQTSIHTHSVDLGLAVTDIWRFRDGLGFLLAWGCI